LKISANDSTVLSYSLLFLMISSAVKLGLDKQVFNMNTEPYT